MTDYENDAAHMPCDETLLEPLGRVGWAAARLHAGIRDAINHMKGASSDKPFEVTLGSALGQLRDLADKRVREPQRTELLDWCKDVGKPAVEERNKVVHGITYTAKDGLQAIQTSDRTPPGRFLAPDLTQVAGQLVDASRRLPAGPYTLKP